MADDAVFTVKAVLDSSDLATQAAKAGSDAKKGIESGFGNIDLTPKIGGVGGANGGLPEMFRQTGEAAQTSARETRLLSLEISRMAAEAAEGSLSLQAMLLNSVKIGGVLGKEGGLVAGFSALGSGLAAAFSNPVTLAVLGTTALAEGISLVLDRTTKLNRVLDSNKEILGDFRKEYGTTAESVIKLGTSTTPAVTNLEMRRNIQQLQPLVDTLGQRTSDRVARITAHELQRQRDVAALLSQQQDYGAAFGLQDPDELKRRALAPQPVIPAQNDPKIIKAVQEAQETFSKSTKDSTVAANEFLETIGKLSKGAGPADTKFLTDITASMKEYTQARAALDEMTLSLKFAAEAEEKLGTNTSTAGRMLEQHVPRLKAIRDVELDLLVRQQEYDKAIKDLGESSASPLEKQAMGAEYLSEHKQGMREALGLTDQYNRQINEFINKGFQGPMAPQGEAAQRLADQTQDIVRDLTDKLTAARTTAGKTGNEEIVRDLEQKIKDVIASAQLQLGEIQKTAQRDFANAVETSREARAKLEVQGPDIAAEQAAQAKQIEEFTPRRAAQSLEEAKLSLKEYNVQQQIFNEEQAARAKEVEDFAPRRTALAWADALINLNEYKGQQDSFYKNQAIEAAQVAMRPVTAEQSLEEAQLNLAEYRQKHGQPTQFFGLGGIAAARDRLRGRELETAVQSAGLNLAAATQAAADEPFKQAIQAQRFVLRGPQLQLGAEEAQAGYEEAQRKASIEPYLQEIEALRNQLKGRQLSLSVDESQAARDEADRKARQAEGFQARNLSPTGGAGPDEALRKLGENAVVAAEGVQHLANALDEISRAAQQIRNAPETAKPGAEQPKALPAPGQIPIPALPAPAGAVAVPTTPPLPTTPPTITTPSVASIRTAGDAVASSLQEDASSIRAAGDAVASSLRSAASAIAGAAASIHAPSHSGGDGGGGGNGKAFGGFISGPGDGTSDSIPIMASAGEYIINAASTARIGLPFLDALNARRMANGGLVRRFADGGVVPTTVGAMLVPSLEEALRNEGAPPRPGSGELGDMDPKIVPGMIYKYFRKVDGSWTDTRDGKKYSEFIVKDRLGTGDPGEMWKVHHDQGIIHRAAFWPTSPLAISNAIRARQEEISNQYGVPLAPDDGSIHQLSDDPSGGSEGWRAPFFGGRIDRNTQGRGGKWVPPTYLVQPGFFPGGDIRGGRMNVGGYPAVAGGDRHFRGLIESLDAVDPIALRNAHLAYLKETGQSPENDPEASQFTHGNPEIMKQQYGLRLLGLYDGPIDGKAGPLYKRGMAQAAGRTQTRDLSIVRDLPKLDPTISAAAEAAYDTAKTRAAAPSSSAEAAGLFGRAFPTGSLGIKLGRGGNNNTALWQMSLKYAGWYNGAIDGVDGPLTKAAMAQAKAYGGGSTAGAGVVKKEVELAAVRERSGELQSRMLLRQHPIHPSAGDVLHPSTGDVIHPSAFPALHPSAITALHPSTELTPPPREDSFDEVVRIEVEARRMAAAAGDANNWSRYGNKAAEMVHRRRANAADVSLRPTGSWTVRRPIATPAPFPHTPTPRAIPPNPYPEGSLGAIIDNLLHPGRYGPANIGMRRGGLIGARVSNGEYRMSADAVRHYGVGLFDRLNFAKGGLVTLSGTPRAEAQVPMAEGVDPAVMAAVGSYRQLAARDYGAVERLVANMPGGPAGFIEPLPGQSTGFVNRQGAIDYVTNYISGLGKGLVPALANVGATTLKDYDYTTGLMKGAPVHQLDMRTNHGDFTVWLSSDTMSAMQATALSAQIYSTGTRPTWWS